MNHLAPTHLDTREMIQEIDPHLGHNLQECTSLIGMAQVLDMTNEQAVITMPTHIPHLAVPKTPSHLQVPAARDQRTELVIEALPTGYETLLHSNLHSPLLDQLIQTMGD